MTMHWSDERLDAALRDFVHARAEEIGAAARPVDVVSAQLAARLGVDADTQRRARRPHWRNPPMSNALKFAVAATPALLLAVVVGLYVSQSGGFVGSPEVTPSPQPSPTIEPTAEPEFQPLVHEATLEPGTYWAYAPPFRVSLTVPDGYSAVHSEMVRRYIGTMPLFVAARSPAASVYRDPCKTVTGGTVPIGPTVDDVVTAMSSQPGRNPTAPTHVTIAGYEGKRFQLQVPDDLEVTVRDGFVLFGECEWFAYRTWEHGWSHDGPGQIDDLWILDVEGSLLVINAGYWPHTSPEDVAELVNIIESIQRIEVSIGVEPTPVEVGMGEPSTPVMSTDREGHTATPLSDGRILIVGGIQQRPDTWGPILDSAETYDHASGAFTLAGSMGEPRYRHAATLLADGRVLFAGGMGAGNAITASAEIYDPNSDAFVPTGPMGSARRDFTATLLADGRVLVAGGWVFENGLVSEIAAGGGAEIYDPVTGQFAPTGLMTVGRVGHTATLLPDGRVLIVGGRRQASAEIYDPASGTFSATGSMAGLRGDHTATLLADGRVLIVGGCSEAQHAAACVDFPIYNNLATAEIYDPASGTFTSTGPMAVERQRHRATLLADGRVLITGGVDRVAGTERLSAEIYDPVSGAFQSATWMGLVRIGHTATLLADGRVLLAGGRSEAHVTLASVELYQP